MGAGGIKNCNHVLVTPYEDRRPTGDVPVQSAIVSGVGRLLLGVMLYNRSIAGTPVEQRVVSRGADNVININEPYGLR